MAHAMTLDRPIAVRCIQVAAMYLLPLALVLVFWARSDSNHWAGGFVPLRYRLLIALWQATGPFAFMLISPPNPIVARLVVFGIVWAGWLTLVMATRLREAPCALHFLAAVLWCGSGFLPTSLVIT
jgi:hypothetical protein